MATRSLAPTPRQRECFEAYARYGDMRRAALEVKLSLSRTKRNVIEYYRRIGANSGVQAAFLTWGPRDEG